MELEDKELEDLIRQILLGRTELFGQIVLEYQNLVYTVCLNIVRNTHDAENAAQETFLTAFQSLSAFKGSDSKSLKSWLCRIATNKSIDYIRKQSRISVVDFSEFEYSEPETEPLEQAFERKELREKLRQVLSELPDKYSAVIQEFYYNERSVKEIARALELPERTVETQLYRAKKLIRERFQEKWGESYEII
ncbi:MAG: RNA polymerase sigma factor [Oscillospiraceae bacterium]|nr:RNA polymerase sigma factor [Oscillospiraceae bacterium]